MGSLCGLQEGSSLLTMELGVKSECCDEHSDTESDGIMPAFDLRSSGRRRRTTSTFDLRDPTAEGIPPGSICDLRGLKTEKWAGRFGSSRRANHRHEAFTRLAETRLAQNTLNYMKIA